MKRIFSFAAALCCAITTTLATPTQGALSGLFSVSAKQKVRFSQGNLQYQASTNTWKFAANQLEFIGSAQSGKISPTYDGWIDLFGWGTGDDPTKSSSSGADYTEWVDWGSNAISNGGNHADLWRTLSADEWAYLFNRGDTSLWGLATIGSVTGLILLPDNWESVKPAGITFNPSAKLMPWNGSESFVGTDGYTHNVLDAEQWETLEAAGAVFLPTALGRGGDVISFWGWGAYWTSTNLYTNAYNMGFSATSVCSGGPSSPHYGYSVRLAINKEPQPGDTIVVDGVKYRVYNPSTQVNVIKQDYTESTLVIPDSIEYAGRKYQVLQIYDNAFRNNTILTSVDIAAKIVCGCAFQGCTNLSELTLREGVETFYTGVFEGIAATTVTIPASLKDICKYRDYSPFANNKLTQIVVAEGNPYYVVGEDGALYNKEMTSICAFPYNYPQKFKEIPSTVKTIFEATFSQCSNIADTLILPESLEVAESAFHMAKGVKCIILNSNYAGINNVFQGSTSIEEVIIGKNVTQVGSLMFRNCSALRKITVYPETMPNWEYGTDSSWPSFSDHGGVFDECKVYIHCGQSATYAADVNKWANFTNLIDTLLYDVVPTAGANGSVAITGTTDCNEVHITATPDEHYEFDAWSNGLTTAEITLAVTSDTAVAATFKKAKYKIGFYKDADDAAAAVASTKLAGTTQYYQTDVTSVADIAKAKLTRPECSRFLGWTEDGSNLFDITSLSKTANVYPLWDMNPTFTVTFKDRTTDQVIGEPQTDLDCHDQAIAPTAEEGYYWEWESDAWMYIQDDIVIYGTKKSTPTAIDQVESGEPKVESRKILRDGQLFILRDGRTYNAQGVEVK